MSSQSSNHIIPLKWDSDFFGIKCAKYIINETIEEEPNDMEEKMKVYDFVSIENRNSNSTNAIKISLLNNTHLADVLLLFRKKATGLRLENKNVQIFEAYEGNEELLDLAVFENSKFVLDPKLAKRGGRDLYRNWVRNSFNDEKKIFAVYLSESRKALGFSLFKIEGIETKIELIAVSNAKVKKGIGTILFNSIENESILRGAHEIVVGTQLRNTNAINFYNKLGCRHITSHEIYHKWHV